MESTGPSVLEVDTGHARLTYERDIISWQYRTEDGEMRGFERHINDVKRIVDNDILNNYLRILRELDRDGILTVEESKYGTENIRDFGETVRTAEGL